MNDLQTLRELVLDGAELEAFLATLKTQPSPDQYQRIGALFQVASKVVGLLEGKNLSIARLRQLVFGARTESARNVCGGPTKEPKPGKRPGHGRRSQQSYTGARRIRVAHAAYQAGQECPKCRRGKLRSQRQPATAVHLSAQPPVGALIYEMERLRCQTCGEVYTAATPPEAALEKYTPSVGVLVGMMRYGSGVPFYRLERMQESVGVPLPASIQWEQALRVGRVLKPVVDQLIYLGAQSAVFFSDDTTMRILRVRQQIQAEIRPKRTGIFTTGIVCEGTGSDPTIQLFFTGRQHAGENLSAVLARREADLPAPLHMCDGLPQNDPKGYPTQSCHCVVHARRGFVEIQEAFPEECQFVVECFSEVYRVEAACQKDHLTPAQRLHRHQVSSQPVMERLKSWCQDKLDGKTVEPNSGLGDAMNYLLKRWETLTCFLRVEGAPLDNNITERLLKSSILHRKNSLHYRTTRGAEVGDRFMSVIQTCRANDVNPFDYMVTLMNNIQGVQSDPAQWMPWNYQETLAQTNSPSG